VRQGAQTVNKLSPLASVSATRDVLEAHGLATKKALGQHFLINDGIVKRICDVAAVSLGDVVLEVGPGIGTLSIALLQKAGFVVAVERDADLPAVLANTCAQYTEKFAVINKDALELNETDLRQVLEGQLPNKFVANLPYAVAATLVLDYFEHLPCIESATVMVQKEVADRMCAKPGTKAYGAYTIKLSLFARPVDRFSVGTSNFFPPPRVESAVLRLDRCPVCDSAGQPCSSEVVQAACTMADAAFATRRKTILNSCKSYFEAKGVAGQSVAQAIPHILEQAGIDPKLRGETLSPQDFLRLGAAYMSF